MLSLFCPIISCTFSCMSYYSLYNCTFFHQSPALFTANLMTSAAKVGSINSTTSLVAAPQDKSSSSSSSTTCTTLFLLCAEHFKSAFALWNHINSIHISRQGFPAVSYFLLHNCLICSSSACHWVYYKHLVQSGCLRPGNGGKFYCCSTLLDPAVALVDVQVKTLPLPTNLLSAHSVSAHESLFDI